MRLIYINQSPLRSQKHNTFPQTVLQFLSNYIHLFLHSNMAHTTGLLSAVSLFAGTCVPGTSDIYAL